MIVRFPCLCEKPVAKNHEAIFAVISVIGGYIANAITSVRKYTDLQKTDMPWLLVL